MIPKDPVMLLSFVNLKLRDYYQDLETFQNETAWEIADYSVKNLLFCQAYANKKDLNVTEEELNKLLEEYAFGFLKLRMLYAIIATKNVACSSIYKKEGYVPSSILRAWTLEDDAILWQKINQE